MNSKDRFKKTLLLSVYGNHIQQFIDLKRQLGFKYVTGAVIFSQIDALALQRDETTEGITKSFADAWQIKRHHESSFYHYTRVQYLIQISGYLRDMGIPSYIPKLPPFPKHTYIPYIYSSSEIQALFSAFDNFKSKLVFPNSCLVCIPAYPINVCHWFASWRGSSFKRS